MNDEWLCVGSPAWYPAYLPLFVMFATLPQFIIHNFQSLIAIDHRILLAINHLNAPWLDAVMTFASDRRVWFPFYAVLLGWLIWHFRRRAWVAVPLLLLAVALADSITSRLFKPIVGRLRPCHAPGLAAQLHLPDGCGGQFGFLSSHAANSFALAFFLLLALPAGRYNALKIGVFLWAALLSYSRMYLGAHYPSDVLGGALVGAALAWGAARLAGHLGSHQRFAD